MPVKMVCFTEGPFAQEARALGIDTQVLPGRNFFSATLNTLTHMVQAEGFDIIHSHGARGNMMAAFLAKRTGLPTVSTVHSDYRLDYLGRPLSRITYGTINTIALRKLDYRIGVSDAMVDLLIDRRFDPERIFAIYNGLDFTPRTPSMDRATFFRSVGLDADDTCVVAGIAARLNPVKDIATLIRGFARAHAEYPLCGFSSQGMAREMESLKSWRRFGGCQRSLLRRVGLRHGFLLPRIGHQHADLYLRNLPLRSHGRGRGPGCPPSAVRLAASPTSLTTGPTVSCSHRG